MNVTTECDQRNYFSFNNYKYKLDVTKQNKWMSETKPMEAGLVEAYSWYINHSEEVNRKPYLKYIDDNFK